MIKKQDGIIKKKQTTTTTKKYFWYLIRFQALYDFYSGIMGDFNFYQGQKICSQVWLLGTWQRRWYDYTPATL